MRSVISLFSCGFLGLLVAVPATAQVDQPTYVRHWGRFGAGIGQMRIPSGVGIDEAGNFYVSELQGDRVQKFDPQGNALWGRQGAEGVPFDRAADVVADRRGRVWVSDSGNGRIVCYSTEGDLLSLVQGPATGLRGPNGLAVDASGDNLYVVDAGDRVAKFDISGEQAVLVFEFGEFGEEPDQFIVITDVAVAPNGEIWVVDVIKHRVQIFSPEGRFRMAFGQNGTGPGEFSTPAGIVIDAAGDAYIMDTFNARIQKMKRDGTFILQWGWAADTRVELLTSPLKAAIGPGNLLYVADGPDNIVQTSRVVVYEIPLRTAIDSVTWSDIRRLYLRD